MKTAMAVAALTAAHLAIPASAATVIDQQLPAQSPGYAFGIASPYTGTNTPFGQSFTDGIAGTFAMFDFIQNFANASANLSYKVLAGDGTSGPELGSGNQNVGCNYVGGYCHIKVDVSGLNILLTPGQQYTFLITGISTGGNFAANTAIGYSGGKAYLGPQYASYANDGYELDFRTYVTTPVPEPMTWAMMVAGFGVVGCALRRRRDSIAVA